MIRLVLHGELRQFSPASAKMLEVEGAGRRARDLIATLGIPIGEAAAFVRNGEQCEADVVLADGDTLEVLPAISGGADRARRGG